MLRFLIPIFFFGAFMATGREEALVAGMMTAALCFLVTLIEFAEEEAKKMKKSDCPPHAWKRDADNLPLYCSQCGLCPRE